MVIIGDTEICGTNEIALLGKHNWQNVCAAVTTVWQITKDVQAIRSVISSFSGGDFRLQFVRELNGIKFYNDSFGTTPETATVALESFEQPKVLILGGGQKNSDYSELVKTIKKASVRKVILIGNTANEQHPTASLIIKEKLVNEGYSDIIDLTAAQKKTMDEIVATSFNEAKEGDIILLSTACTSYDMFENYKVRGEKFTQAVLRFSGPV